MTWISKTSMVASTDEIFYGTFFNPGSSTYEKFPTKWSAKYHKYLWVCLINNFLSKSNSSISKIMYKACRKAVILLQAKLYINPNYERMHITFQQADATKLYPKTDIFYIWLRNGHTDIIIIMMMEENKNHMLLFFANSNCV